MQENYPSPGILLIGGQSQTISMGAGCPQEGTQYTRSVFPAEDTARWPTITNELLAHSKRREEAEGRKVRLSHGHLLESVVASDPCLFSTHSPQWLQISAQLPQPLFVSMQTCSLGVVLPGIINVNKHTSQRLRCCRQLHPRQSSNNVKH